MFQRLKLFLFIEKKKIINAQVNAFFLCNCFNATSSTLPLSSLASYYSPHEFFRIISKDYQFKNCKQLQCEHCIFSAFIAIFCIKVYFMLFHTQFSS